MGSELALRAILPARVRCATMRPSLARCGRASSAEPGRRPMKYARLMTTALPLSVAAAGLSAINAAEQPLNPKAIAIKLPEQIPWKRNAAGTNEVAVLIGDPSKPGLYVEMFKWLPGNMSRPHWHPNDRYITVLKGTWWVGTGDTFAPDTTVPLPTGSYVSHFGK